MKFSIGKSMYDLPIDESKPQAVLMFERLANLLNTKYNTMLSQNNLGNLSNEVILILTTFGILKELEDLKNNQTSKQTEIMEGLVSIEECENGVIQLLNSLKDEILSQIDINNDESTGELFAEAC